MKNLLNKLRQIVFSEEFRAVPILFVFAILASSITYLLFTYTETLLTNRLQERLIAIAATGAESFEVEDIEEVQTVEDVEKDSFKKIVDQLNKIKDANSNIRYAYIMRRTEDPLTLEFVADAESLLTTEELDTNGDGIIQDEEATPLPGDPFEIAEYPVLQEEAFFKPSVDRELEQDQWSVQLSSYAPIFNEEGEAIAIFGIDVVVDDFLALTRETFLPFLLFILFLVLLLTLLTVLLVRFWSERVNAVKEVDKQKDELLGIVSHQLATPVSSIKWYTEMLMDGDLGKVNKDQHEHLHSMMGVAGNLSDLVSMILDVSRIQLGRMRVEKQELDLAEFFKEIIEVIQPKAVQKNQKFNIDIPAKFPKAMLDKRYTHMTIENLLSNAVKYTPENGVVSFNVKLQGNTLHCEISDNGCGIPKADQEKIFGKLFRASNVRNTVDGNGFGLFVAKGAVEAQGGKIWFNSEEGKGTTFYVELPLQ